MNQEDTSARNFSNAFEKLLLLHHAAASVQDRQVSLVDETRENLEEQKIHNGNQLKFRKHHYQQRLFHQ